MAKKFDALIFDLDGTLLDTLDDLANSVNHALVLHGQPARRKADIRAFLGNGIRNLIRRSVREGTSEALYEEIFDCFKAYYVEHCMERTAPYAGIMPMLATLKETGMGLAIVSNKLDAAVKLLNARFFEDYVSIAVGESATVRRKPCPDAVFAAMEKLGCDASSTAYVGDSEVDVETARNAGIPCISVLWGFRDEDFLRERFPKGIFAKTPEELLALVEEDVAM